VLVHFQIDRRRARAGCCGRADRDRGDRHGEESAKHLSLPFEVPNCAVQGEHAPCGDVAASASPVMTTQPARYHARASELSHGNGRRAAPGPEPARTWVYERKGRDSNPGDRSHCLTVFKTAA